MKIERNISKVRVILLISILLFFSSLKAIVSEKPYVGLNRSENRIAAGEIRMHGVKIFVENMKSAEDFYCSFLGFKVEERGSEVIKLATGQYPIYLIKSDVNIARKVPSESHYAISFLTSKLLPAIDAARESNFSLYDTLLSRNGIGIHIPIADPSGNFLHLMEVQVGNIPDFEGFRLYNSGVTVNNMKNAEQFYKPIFGFEDWSRDYLPDALPLKHSDGSFAFMLHEDEQLKQSTYTYGAYPGIVQVLETSDLKEFIKYLNSIKIKHKTLEESILVQDRNGNVIEILGM